VNQPYQPRHGQQQYPAPQQYGAPQQQYAAPQQRSAPQRYGNGHQNHPAPRPPAAQAPTAPPAPRRRRKLLWIIGGVVLLLVVIGVANGGQTPSTTPTSSPTPAGAGAGAAEPAASGMDQITYEVTGDGVSKANNITYVKDSNFGQQQDNGASLPWSKTIEFENGVLDLQPMTLVAQSGSGKSGGTITCRILRNGAEVTSSTSSGPYAVVTCSGGLG